MSTVIPSQAPKPHVGLFVTCLVNTLRPSIGFATLALLEQAGCKVTVPEQQSCCGQPSFNSGDDNGTRTIAKAFIKHFEPFDYIVVPSGSCAAMLKNNMAPLFINLPEWHERAQTVANKVWEVLSFLNDVCHYSPVDVCLPGRYTYHDSCSGLRSLNIYQQPRDLLDQVAQLDYHPMSNSTECCGFGGTFCVKYSDISNAIVAEKTEQIVATQADYLLGGDWGCLMNMAGKINRDTNSSITALHAVEVLAGMADELTAVVPEDQNE